MVISKRSFCIDAIAVDYLVNLNTLVPRNALLLDALILACNVSDVVKAD
jgi:hypothetical protein